MKITKEIVDQLETDPIEYVSKLKENKLENLLRELSSAYYNTNKPLISDTNFDILKEQLKKINANNKFLFEVGAPVNKNDEVNLPYPMGSLDKIKPDTNALDNWLEIYGGKYIVSDKLDGLSCQLHIINNEIKLYTRGNGVIGKDITHLLGHLNINNKALEKLKKNKGELSLRGELIIKKNDFKQITDKKNIRNTVAGLVNSKKPDKRITNLIRFVCYSVLHPRMTYEKQMSFLLETGLDVVNYGIYRKISNEMLSNKLVERKKESEYDIDGIVVFDSSVVYEHEEGIPEYGFAFKSQITMDSIETTVIDVLWDITMDAYLKPRVKIEEVKLAGVSINYATAFHAKFVEENELGVGAIIKIIRSGDVIPHIVEIIKGAKKTKMPKIKYAWNKTHTNIIATDIKGEYLQTMQSKRMDYFFSTIGIKHLSIGILTKFVENGYTNVIELLKADREELTKISGLGEKIIKKIFDKIDDVMKTITLDKLITGSHVFGQGIADKRIKLIVKKIPDLLSLKKIILREQIMEIEGFSDITTDKFIDNLDSFKDFFNDLKKLYTLDHIDRSVKQNTNTKNDKQNNKQNNVKMTMENEIIIMTGFRDEKLEKYIEENGGKVGSSVSKKTTLLIYKNKDDNSSKIKKAKDLDIKMISYQDFSDKYIREIK